MFPMISDISQLLEAKSILADVMSELEERKIKFNVRKKICFMWKQKLVENCKFWG